MDFSNVTVLCVGDVMLDRFVYGEMERISPEAPVPVVRLTRTREMLGGAGNVANNIASLGGRAVLVGLLGQDQPGATIRRLTTELPGITGAFIDSGARPTICKTRLIAGRQQVVRTDEESRLALQPEEEAHVRSTVEAHVGATQVMILSDYAKGLLSPALIAFIIQRARDAGIAVFVDPKSPDFRHYRGASCIKPNLKELAAASDLPVGTEAEVAAASRKVMAAAEAGAILTTRSEHGMLLVESDGAMHSAPSRAREVFDVSGAGDTAIAALALARASGRTLAQAMQFANAAAGVVVSKLGTATADVAEVLHELAAQDHAPTDVPHQLQPVEAVVRLVARWKDQGLVVGFASGGFDILRASDVRALSEARAQCDRLIVALRSDAGAAHPVNGLGARAQVVAALRHVDCVTSFDGDTRERLIDLLRPDVIVAEPGPQSAPTA